LNLRGQAVISGFDRGDWSQGASVRAPIWSMPKKGVASRNIVLLPNYCRTSRSRLTHTRLHVAKLSLRVRPYTHTPSRRRSRRKIYTLAKTTPYLALNPLPVPVRPHTCAAPTHHPPPTHPPARPPHRASTHTQPPHPPLNRHHISTVFLAPTRAGIQLCSARTFRRCQRKRRSSCRTIASL